MHVRILGVAETPGGAFTMMALQSAQLSTEQELQSAYTGTRIAAEYVDRRFRSELNRLLHERQVAAVDAVMTGAQPSRSLEIAPGPGRVTRDVVPCSELICLEYNVGMIREGQHVCPRVTEWVCGNAFEVPFANDFDFVYTFRFIRHFRADDRSRLYEQIRNVLKPQGYLVFDAVSESQSQPIRLRHPEAYPVYDVLYSRRQLCEELRSAGFAEVRLKPVQKFYRWQYWSQVVIGPRSRWLNRLIVRGLERFPRLDGLEWIVTCRRA